MQNRRDFIKKSGLGIIGLSLTPNVMLAAEENIKITILHTNDMHSHIHPIKSGEHKGLGGMAQRANIIKAIRKKERNVILLDAGDIFQGTPYFNFYEGELEIKLMSEMQYDAATIGNHDFDNGLKGLKKQLKHANFPFVNANYNFQKTILKNTFKPYKIFKKGGVKIGVLGVGVELEGLVPKKLYGNTIYEDPIEKARHYASILKKKKKCDLIICLSHLGLRYETNKISDIILAKKTKYIDLIIGGHTHTFLNKPIKILNTDNQEVLINQVGWAGINLGRIDFSFSQNGVKKKSVGQSIFVEKSKKNA